MFFLVNLDLIILNNPYKFNRDNINNYEFSSFCFFSIIRSTPHAISEANVSVDHSPIDVLSPVFGADGVVGVGLIGFSSSFMRHDLHHHIHMINYYLEEKEYDKLQTYVNEYRDSIPNGDRIRFCENHIINNILFYFASHAKEHNIDFSVQLSIPNNLNIADHEIAVLLGNLLENAIDACMNQKNSDRRIIVKGECNAHSLLFTIDNTFENEIKRNKRGDLLTTKPEGNGIGVESAKKIVERYHGFFSADQKDNLFCVSFILNF